MSRGSESRVKRRGLRRGAGNLGRYSKPPKPKMTGKKLSKKTDLRYTCKVCSKTVTQRQGFRSKKVELV
jgi:ribosomal protein L44E